VRDVNGPALAAQIAEVGGEPRDAGCVRDEREAMRAAIASALQVGADLVVVSGGSSQGARDLTAAVLDGFGPPGVLAHGIAVGPGKPTIIAGAAGPRCLVPLIGMPGHPVSSLVIFRLFVGPLVRRLGGESPPADPFPARRRAVLARNVASKPGREDYVRVRVTESEHGMARAEPLLGGTAALSTVLLADGLVRIPLEREGLAAGEEVEVLLW
jgi:molybdopterin molybdotransferase